MKYHIIIFKKDTGHYAILPGLNELRTDKKIYFYTGADGIVAQYELDEIESIITVETPVDELPQILGGAAALAKRMRTEE